MHDIRKRRSSWVRPFCEQFAWWSRRWFVQAVQWDARLTRDFHRQQEHFSDGVPRHLIASEWSFALAFRHWHAEEFLASQTQMITRNSLLGTTSRRTGLRHGRACVYKRFYEGVSYGRFSFLEQSF